MVPGQTYTVGERGPETLVMGNQSGSIVPNGGGGTTINLGGITINGSVLGNKEEIARVVGDAIMTRLKATGTRFPSGA